MSAKLVPLGPLYSAQLDIHLGADTAWDRPDNKNVKRVIQKRSPTDLWAAILSETAQMLGVGDDRFIFGMLINTINSMPDEQRAQFLMGIVDGTGMTIERSHDSVDVNVTEGLFPALRVTPNGNLEKTTPSGLIVAGNPGLIVPGGG